MNLFTENILNHLTYLFIIFKIKEREFLNFVFIEQMTQSALKVM